MRHQFAKQYHLSRGKPKFAKKSNCIMKSRKPRKKPVNEEDAQLFKELCEAVTQLGIETRVEDGNFRGGICLVEGEKEILFINKKHPLDKRIALIISELKRMEISEDSLPKELLPKIEKWF